MPILSELDNAGNPPPQPALRKRADDVMDYTVLTFDAPREETSPEATPATTEQHPLFEKVQNLQLTYSDDLETPLEFAEGCSSS